MPLTPEQVKQLKEQLKSQISHLPPDKRDEAEGQIDAMSSDALEMMLQQQQARSPSPAPEDGKTIFRMLVSGEVEAIKIAENEEAIAVLDINPISRGHIMIIPKSPAASPDKIPQSAFKLAESLSKKITENLKAKEVKAETSTDFGESIIHLIPIYDKPLTKDSPRTKAAPEDLQTLKTELEKEVISLDKKPKEVIKLDKNGKIIEEEPSETPKAPETPESADTSDSKEKKKPKKTKKEKPIKLSRRIP
tara:strand:- start:27 stop:773 length:747 start_codon:yes stop_codon:yes gene_type:complete